MSTFQTRIVNDKTVGTPGVNWGAPHRNRINSSPIRVIEKSLWGLKGFIYNDVSYEVTGMVGGGFNCWYLRWGFIPWRGKAVSYLTVARKTGSDDGKVRAFDLIHQRWNETWVVVGETEFFHPGSSHRLLLDHGGVSFI